MRKNILTIILIILCAVLAVELGFVCVNLLNRQGAAAVLSTEPMDTDPSDGSSEPTDGTDATDATDGTDATDPSSDPTGESTQPAKNSFLLTFTGDSTLGSDPNLFSNGAGFIFTIGNDYQYPYRNISQYFKNDDMTFVNLEGVFANDGAGATKLFVFRGPTDYIKILTQSSVEAVTLANNHTMDFGMTGYISTKDTLEKGGVTYVEQDGSAIYTTESGLVVGIYGAAFNRNDADMRNEIAALRNKGAQVIVAAVHWGNEGQYRATQQQKDWGHALIDAGVDIVWGNHPHTLQPIEQYKDGIIYYSLGNCSFGGNTWPRDLDTAVLQQEVILNADGSVSLGELTIIPCSISSATTGQNNFQPTPYEKDSAQYKRVLSKLDGSFTGPDLTVDYSHLNPSTPEGGDEGSTEGDGGNTEGDTGNTGGDTGSTGGDTGSTGGDTGSTGGDTGSTGGDTGSTGGDTGSTGGDTGSTGGDTGSTGGDTGSTGGDTGSTGGDTGSTGGDTGSTGGDTGSTGGDTGSTGGDAGSSGGDAGSSGGDAGSSGGDAGGSDPVV